MRRCRELGVVCGNFRFDVTVVSVPPRVGETVVNSAFSLVAQGHGCRNLLLNRTILQADMGSGAALIGRESLGPTRAAIFSPTLASASPKLFAQLLSRVPFIPEAFTNAALRRLGAAVPSRPAKQIGITVSFEVVNSCLKETLLQCRHESGNFLDRIRRPPPLGTAEHFSSGVENSESGGFLPSQPLPTMLHRSESVRRIGASSIQGNIYL